MTMNYQTYSVELEVVLDELVEELEVDDVLEVVEAEDSVLLVSSLSSLALPQYEVRLSKRSS
jgi:hypothetical protein